MHTENRLQALNIPVAIILAAHQDDETGVFQQVHSHVQAAERVVYACLTKGLSEKSAAQRNRETTNVLTRMGVNSEDIFFAGDMLGIDDLTLIEHMPAAGQWLKEWLAGFEAVAAVYCPAFEGGHPDHDALHVLAVQLCHELGSLPAPRQYPLYNNFEVPWQLFRTYSPLESNGPVETIRMPWRSRFFFLSCALRYRSQWKTLIGLFPFWVMHYLFWGTQQLQPTSLDRILNRPHDGALYYEKRKFAKWELVNERIRAWLVDREASRA